MAKSLNVALKYAVINSRKNQFTIARKAKIHPSRFSRIVRGREKPSPEEKERIAIALALPESALFPEPVSA